MWVGWVHHSWRFGHAEALREMGPECLKADQKRQRLSNFSNFFGAIQMISCWALLMTMDETRSITHLCWCNWRTFWRKNTAGRSPRVFCSCTTTPRLTGHLHPRRNWPTWASSVLITHPILWIWPRRTTTCSLDWKNNWQVTIFYPTRRSLLPARPGWTDKFPGFFSGLQKLEQRTKKSIQLHREYVDYIPSLVAVACFLPGRAKNLLATPRLISLTAFRYAEVYWTHGALAKAPHWLVSKWQWGSRSVSGRGISLSTKSLSPVALSTMFCIRLTGWHVLPQHPVLCSAETLSVVALSNLFCVLLTGCHLLPSAPCSVSYWQTVACCPSTLFCVLLTRSHLLPPAPCSVFCWQPVYSELESLPKLTS